MIRPRFDEVRPCAEPFPHFSVPEMIDRPAAAAILSWLRGHAPWRLQVTDFYEQYEFSLLAEDIDKDAAFLVAAGFITALSDALERLLGAGALTLVDVVAHRLEAGQTIRIHNDFIEGAETHRLVLQLNDGWNEDNGGLLMLFGNDDVASLDRIVAPLHGSAFGFEISPKSHHAVSTIHAGERYTLVYTFRERPARSQAG